MKKAIITTALVILLCLSVPLSAFAATSTQTVLNGRITKKWIYVHKDHGGYNAVDVTSSSTWQQFYTGDYGLLTIPNPGYNVFGFSAYFGVNPTVQVSDYRYWKLNLTATDGVSLPSLQGDETFTVNYKIVNDLGQTTSYKYDLNTEVSDDGIWTASSIVDVGTADLSEKGWYLSGIDLITNFPAGGYTNGDYSVQISFKYAVEVDDEERRHAEVLGAIDESTDQITNGWTSDDDSAGEVGDLTGDLESAENEALGGKSDEDIKAEVDTALNGEGLPDPKGGASIAVADSFDTLLGAFGADYQSLLLLSLTLGLAAFLVGRSYRARGD